MSQATDSAGLIGSGLGAATSFSGVGGLLGIAGTLAGIFGGGSGGQDPAQAAYQQMAQILNAGLNKAINFDTNYTNQAVGQQKNSLQQAIQALTGYSQQAQQSATNSINQGLQQYQQLQQPYAKAGYDALDAYKQSLGLSTPLGGSYQSVQNQQLVNQLQPLLKSLNGQYNPSAPSLQSITSGITQKQIQQYIQQHTVGKDSFNQGNGALNGLTYTYNGVGSTPGSVISEGAPSGLVPWNNGFLDPKLQNQLVSSLTGNQGISSQVQNYLANQQYQPLLNQYNQQQGTVNQINSLLQGADVNQLAPLLRGSL